MSAVASEWIKIIAEFQEIAFFVDGGEEKGGTQSTEESGSSKTEEVDATEVPDSPSKQLPDQISFFSGNPSVEIIHGIMHLYKTK